MPTTQNAADLMLSAMKADRDAQRAAVIARAGINPATHMVAARVVNGAVVSTIHTQGCGCRGYAGTIGRPVAKVHPDELARATRAKCAA